MTQTTPDHRSLVRVAFEDPQLTRRAQGDLLSIPVRGLPAGQALLRRFVLSSSERRVGVH